MSKNFFGFALKEDAQVHPFVYLSAPYGYDAEGTEANVARAEEVAAVLMERGYQVFCPLVHHIHIVNKTRGPFYFAPIVDAIVMGRVDALVVINFEECFECRRVRRDVELAEELGLPINLVTPGERIASHLAGELAVEPAVHADMWKNGGYVHKTMHMVDYQEVREA